MISAAGFRLKGGGWYETDFKTGNKKNVAASGESSSSSSKNK
jgi:predicted nucleic acid-binding Zn ribbon protein